MTQLIVSISNFTRKGGIYPEIFSPYSCSEFKDIAPTLTTGCGNHYGISAIIIIEGYNYETSSNFNRRNKS